MQMNPKYFFENFVKPNYDEFCDADGNLRLAFNAVVSLAHMADNYFNYYKRRNDVCVALYSDFVDFKTHLSSLSVYYNDIQSIANAYKHLYTNSGKIYVTIESGGAVYVEEAVDDTEGSDDEIEPELTHSTNEVYYTRKDGTEIELRQALDSVMSIWSGIL